MSFFQWKDSFNIGDDTIDRQHRAFLEMLNEFYDGSSGCTKDCIDGQLIVGIREYAAMHFRFEEQLMREAGYPEIESQIKQHRYFESLITELETKSLKNNADDLKRMLSMLRDWFLHHILEEDRKFVPQIKKPGQGGA